MWKKDSTVLMVALVVLYTWLTTYYLFNNHEQSLSTTLIRPHVRVDDTLTKDKTLATEHANRIQHLRHVCSDLDSDQHRRNSNSTNMVPSLLYSKKYNFSYCMVPKVGSTFWLQLFSILSNGAESAMSIFAKPRKSVHQTLSGGSKANFDLDNETAQPRTILVSRDPYSRLYSAYVDKVFLPNMWPVAKSVESIESFNKVEAMGCGKNATFSGFLSLVIKNATTGSFNSHWKPITRLCSPCDLDIYIVVKQESFTADVEFALKQLKIGKDELESINAGMKSRRAESTIPGIVKTVLWKTKAGRASRCLSATEVAKRLWTSFQIQGFIHDKFTFPLKKFESSEKARNSTYLSDAIIAAIKRSPLTSEERTIQRRRYLVKAYQSVPTHIIDRLQYIYRLDFRLFGYSIDPPTQL